MQVLSVAQTKINSAKLQMKMLPSQLPSVTMLSTVPWRNWFVITSITAVREWTWLNSFRQKKFLSVVNQVVRQNINTLDPQNVTIVKRLVWLKNMDVLISGTTAGIQINWIFYIDIAIFEKSIYWYWLSNILILMFLKNRYIYIDIVIFEKSILT